MKVLIIGSGGREHALAWKLAQSPRVSKVFVAPGNAGTAQQGVNIPISPEDLDALVSFAEKEKIGMTFVGPEAPLVSGVVDRFRERGLLIFGPTAKAAQIEGSKVFMKELMKKYDIPTARYEVFSSPKEAIESLSAFPGKMVVKAEGLAAGKGVILCANPEEGKKAIQQIMVNRAFGSAGDRVIIEEFLEGQEASIHVFTDGKSLLPLPPSQDHKQIFDGDKGPNTGGMGAYAPAPLITKALEKEILETIVQKTIDALREEGCTYQGVLYAGLMITKQGPKVLEFNARLGDPETQVLLPLLKNDLVEVAEACINGTLSRIHMECRTEYCTCVVLAAGGYPGPYEKGIPITGLGDAHNRFPIAFHAGTTQKENTLVTNGGRVVGISALGHTLEESVQQAYQAQEKIQFEGKTYRTDIAQKALH